MCIRAYMHVRIHYPCIHTGGQLCRLCDCCRLSCYSVHLGNTHQCQNRVFSCYRQQAWSLQRGLQCTTLQHNATYCNILQGTARHCSTISQAQSLPHGHANAHSHTRTRQSTRAYTSSYTGTYIHKRIMVLASYVGLTSTIYAGHGYIKEIKYYLSSGSFRLFSCPFLFLPSPLSLSLISFSRSLSRASRSLSRSSFIHISLVKIFYDLSRVALTGPQRTRTDAHEHIHTNAKTLTHIIFLFCCQTHVHTYTHAGSRTGSAIGRSDSLRPHCTSTSAHILCLSFVLWPSKMIQLHRCKTIPSISINLHMYVHEYIIYVCI